MFLAAGRFGNERRASDVRALIGTYDGEHANG
ncbi:hypothetical protein BH23CHL10_BH23CHL10_07040 [soil metagenome]